MNTLKIYPKALKKNYEQNMLANGIKNPLEYHAKIFYGCLISALIIGGVLSFSNLNLPKILLGVLGFFSAFILFMAFFYFRIAIKASARIKKMETLFPDVIQLMASNLRAGMTIDKAFLLSARQEFYPLSDEIIKIGNEISTGKDVSLALKAMGERIGSEKITKTLLLIISGIRSGGNISSLLEQTASNMREKEFIEKRAASSVIMYVVFILFAVGVGAPLLFGLSGVLINIIMKIVGSLPALPQNAQATVPITFKGVSISSSFIFYFSLLFIVMSDLISSLLIGLVNKGEEKAGLRYFLPLLLVSVSLFVGIRFVLTKFLTSTFSAFK